MSYPIELTFYSGNILVEDQYLEGKTNIVANGKEIWSTYDNHGLGLLKFRLGASKDNYNPEFHLKSYENYCWDQKQDLLRLLRDLDTIRKAEPGEYHLLFVRDISPHELNQGILESLRKRVGLTLLARSSELKPYQRLNWVLIAGKRLRKDSKGLGGGVKLPFQKHIRTWNSGGSPNNTTGVRPKEEFRILGQSLSTNCAEVILKF